MILKRKTFKKKENRIRVQKVNVYLMTVLYRSFRIWLRAKGVKVKKINKVGKLNKPAIVLCNHGSFIDFIYASTLLRKYKPHFIVARLYFYNTILGHLLRKVGAFPKSMFAMDMESTKNSIAVLKNNAVLAMMPEARLSTTGRFEDIQKSTYSFIKKSAVDVYTRKINGDYLANPKWGKGMRRGAVVEVELDILYTAEQLQSLSLLEIKKGIEQRLYYNEFQWLQQRPKIHYSSECIAEGLENILSVCPKCNKKYSIKTEKDKLYCEHCGDLTSLSDRYEFDEDFQFADLTQWYDWQVDLLKKEINEYENYAMTSKVELRLPGNGRGLTRHSGYGTCTLNREGLTYSGTKDGKKVECHFSIQKIYRLLFGAGENFEVYDGTQIHYFVPEERRAAVDWYIASSILYDITSSKPTQ